MRPGFKRTPESADNQAIRPMATRLLTRLVTLLVVSGVLAPMSAQAAPLTVRADLNADGVADTAVLHSTLRAAQIELRLSGVRRPIYLLASAAVETLRPVDLTGDGRTDLVAHTSAGLQVWVNVNGRFVPVPVGQVLASGRTPSTGASPRDVGPQPVSLGGDTAPAGPGYTPAVSPDVPSSSPILPSRAIPLTRARGTSISRAPPIPA